MTLGIIFDRIKTLKDTIFNIVLWAGHKALVHQTAGKFPAFISVQKILRPYGSTPSAHRRSLLALISGYGESTGSGMAR